MCVKKGQVVDQEKIQLSDPEVSNVFNPVPPEEDGGVTDDEGVTPPGSPTTTATGETHKNFPTSTVNDSLPLSVLHTRLMEAYSTRDRQKSEALSLCALQASSSDIKTLKKDYIQQLQLVRKAELRELEYSDRVATSLVTKPLESTDFLARKNIIDSLLDRISKGEEGGSIFAGTASRRLKAERQKQTPQQRNESDRQAREAFKADKGQYVTVSDEIAHLQSQIRSNQDELKTEKEVGKREALLQKEEVLLKKKNQLTKQLKVFRKKQGVRLQIKEKKNQSQTIDSYNPIRSEVFAQLSDKNVVLRRPFTEKEVDEYEKEITSLEEQYSQAVDNQNNKKDSKDSKGSIKTIEKRKIADRLLSRSLIFHGSEVLRQEVLLMGLTEVLLMRYGLIHDAGVSVYDAQLQQLKDQPSVVGLSLEKRESKIAELYDSFNSVNLSLEDISKQCHFVSTFSDEEKATELAQVNLVPYGVQIISLDKQKNLPKAASLPLSLLLPVFDLGFMSRRDIDGLPSIDSKEGVKKALEAIVIMHHLRQLTAAYADPNQVQGISDALNQKLPISQRVTAVSKALTDYKTNVVLPGMAHQRE